MPSVDDLMGSSRAVVLEGDCREILPTITGQVDHVFTDPPYSAEVHKSVRGSARAGMADGNGRHSRCASVRTIDLGFESLDHATRRLCAHEFARLARRWILAFSDIESCHLWRRSFEANDLSYVRTLVWEREGCAPAFTGDRPAAAVECMTLAHPKGKKAWNAGGKRGIYSVPIVANRAGERDSRVHTTQKPLELMLELIQDFTSPSDLVLDPFSGSATTAIAALRLGRRCLCIERDPKYAQLSRDRIAAELSSSTLQAHRAGQLPLLR